MVTFCRDNKPLFEVTFSQVIDRIIIRDYLRKPGCAAGNSYCTITIPASVPLGTASAAAPLPTG